MEEKNHHEHEAHHAHERTHGYHYDHKRHVVDTTIPVESHKVKIILNGKEVQCDSNAYLIDIAKEENIEIPRLCLHDQIRENC